MDHKRLDLSNYAMLNRTLHESVPLHQLGLLTYALCKCPDDTFLHSHIGRVYYSLGLLPQSAKHLDLVINAKSKDPSAYFHRALIYRNYNELTECTTLLEHSVSLTDNADYCLILIAVLIQLGRLDDAILHSTAGFEAHPGDARFSRSKVAALIADKQFEQALQWCNEQDTAGTDSTWPLLRYQIHEHLNDSTKAAIEHQENTRRQVLARKDYRTKASQVLASISDLNLREQLAMQWESKLSKLAPKPAMRNVQHAQQALPRLAMSILVRDEADIIAENIRYHAAHGVQHFIVTDNASIDGTREILAQLQSEYSLEIIDEPSHTIDQDRWVTRMAQQLEVNTDCDWVIHNDADEFWVPDNGSLPEAIRIAQQANDNIGVLSCKRLNMLSDKQQVAATDYAFHHNCFATVKTVPLLAGEQPWSTDSSNCVARMVMDKVLTRIEGLGDIEYGNHGAEHTMQSRECSSITILHYPVRTYKQFERKVVNYGESLAQNDRFTANSSMHLRYWYDRFLEGKLKDDYDSITFNPTRLQTLLRDGFLIEDKRVQSFFQSQLNQPIALSA